MKTPDDVLNRAIRVGDWTLAEQALQSGANVNAADGQPLLLAAVICLSHPDDGARWIQWLVDKGADVRASDSCALRFLSSRECPEPVTQLIQLGADPNACCGDALQGAAGSGSVTVVDALLLGGADPCAHGSLALGIAYARGREDVVRRLLEAGADPFGDDVHLDNFDEHPGCGDLIRAARAAAAGSIPNA